MLKEQLNLCFDHYGQYVMSFLYLNIKMVPQLDIL